MQSRSEEARAAPTLNDTTRAVLDAFRNVQKRARELADRRQRQDEPEPVHNIQEVEDEGEVRLS